MNDKIKYSFLLSSYNDEKTIEKCIKSLISQKNISREKYEIIFVNDGSTDNTLKIASKYKEEIKIIDSKKNKGLANGRNLCVENAKGSWFLFVDCDDYVSDNLLSTLEKQKLNNKNFVFFKRIKDKQSFKKDKKIQSNKMNDSIISRAIHKSLFENYKFPSKYKFAIEDWDFFVFNYNKLKILDITNTAKCYYWYRYNPLSLSKSKNVYRSRLEHSLSIFENPKLKKINLENNIIGHYYEHLYCTSRLWFPDLLKRVKKIKYKSKVTFRIKLQYLVVKIGIFNFLIKKLRKKIQE